jgi:uncharacterized membrane protein YfhO
VETPIDRADVIFRAVKLMPGRHVVEFDYEPFSFEAGAAISVVSLIVAAALAFVIRRRFARK